MNPDDRETVRRWVVDEQRSEAEIQNLIGVTFDRDERPAVRQYLNELRMQVAPIRPSAVTPYQREKIPLIPDIVAKLRRSGGATKTAVATNLGINWDTLDDWIRAGLVRWSPD